MDARFKVLACSLARCCCPAGALSLSTLVFHQEDDVVRQLTGYAMMSPLIKLGKALEPPPAVMALSKVLSAVFPKYDVPFAVSSCSVETRTLLVF